MPHILVKLMPGRSDAQKQALSDAIVREGMKALGNDADAFSVAFEEVPAAEWDDRVFEPDILDHWNRLTKEPGYGRRPDQPARSKT
ncbi:MAG: tautomerase family protein [Brevundimonas sp.]